MAASSHVTAFQLVANVTTEHVFTTEESRPLRLAHETSKGFERGDGKVLVYTFHPSKVSVLTALLRDNFPDVNIAGADSTMPADERDGIVQSLTQGAVRVLVVNDNVMTTGGAASTVLSETEPPPSTAWLWTRRGMVKPDGIHVVFHLVGDDGKKREQRFRVMGDGDTVRHIVI